MSFTASRCPMTTWPFQSLLSWHRQGGLFSNRAGKAERYGKELRIQFMAAVAIWLHVNWRAVFLEEEHLLLCKLFESIFICESAQLYVSFPFRSFQHVYRYEGPRDSPWNKTRLQPFQLSGWLLPCYNQELSWWPLSAAPPVVFWHPVWWWSTTDLYRVRKYILVIFIIPFSWFEKKSINLWGEVSRGRVGLESRSTESPGFRFSAFWQLRIDSLSYILLWFGTCGPASFQWNLALSGTIMYLTKRL